ncbi:MAG: efflux RND transporter periplasmic adaptor subunit [Bacteroidota bacterium]|nr:efflux RND transporter periplasmic adaptor subunit [Bacteroidota bacterium]
MKIKSYWYLLIVFVIIIGGIIYTLRKNEAKKTKSETMQKKMGQSAMDVEVMVIKTVQSVNTISTTGTLLANNESELHAEISGRITGIYFKEGTQVIKGQLLIKINDADVKAQYSKAVQVLKLAKIKLSRIKNLLEKEGVSQQEYDIAANEVATAESEIELIKSQLMKTEIRAPFTGQIGLKYISEGSYITPATKIASVQELNPIKIEFAVSEQYANIIKTGLPIQFKYGNEYSLHSAKILAIEPKIDVISRSIVIRASTANPKSIFLPGSLVTVSLKLDAKNATVQVPTESVIPDLKSQKVYLYKAGVATPIKIETGYRSDSSVLVTKGLTAGDTIITTGMMYLKPTAKVKIKKIRN